MTETEKQIKREERLEIAERQYYISRQELEEEYDNIISSDKEDERELLERCQSALFSQLKLEHSCKCCSPRYPDEFHFSNGKFCVRYDADHPNDIRDDEYVIEDLLKEDKGEKK